MAKASGSSRTGSTKKAGAATRRQAASFPQRPSWSPQRRKDPAFMKNLEAAIAEEYAKSGGAAGGSKTRPAATTAAPAKSAPAKVTPAKAAPKAKSAAAPKTKAAAALKSGRKGSRSDGREALAEELSSLIPDLDAEGLAFLIEQARVHLYNMRVADLEQAAAEAERASTRAHSTGSLRSAGSSRSAGPAGTASDDFSIQSASDGSAYDLVYQGKWKMFTSDEMLAMVRIVSSKDPVAQLTGRLYRWLLAERSDVIKDIPLAGLADPKLKKLVAILRKTFTIKGTK